MWGPRVALPSGTPPTHPLSAGAQGRPRNQGRPRQRGPQRREGESQRGKTGRRGHVCFCTGPSPWSKVPSAKGEQSAPGPPRRPGRGPAAPAPAVGMRISAAAPSATRPQGSLPALGACLRAELGLPGTCVNRLKESPPLRMGGVPPSTPTCPRLTGPLLSQGDTGPEGPRGLAGEVGGKGAKVSGGGRTRFPGWGHCAWDHPPFPSPPPAPPQALRPQC